MAQVTPTTQDVSDNIVSQLELSLNQTVPLLPRAFIRVLAKALAGVFILLYKYAGFMFLQIFVRTASFDTTTVNGTDINPLLAWGRLVGAGDPSAATQAQLVIEITVTTQTGSLPSGAQLLGDNGVTYVTVSSVLLDAPTVQVTARAVSDQEDNGGAGTIGNLEPGATLSFANPVSNVARDTVVVSQAVTGANAETADAYRQRVVDRFQKRPQGGAYADYELWGEETAGIINIYPYTGTCAGEVDVYAEATPASSGNPDGIPTGPQLQAVKDAIELDVSGIASRRPAGALVNVFPITRLGFDVEVVGLDVENEPDVQAAITTALTEYMLDRGPYIVGLSVPPRKDRITRSALSGVVDNVVSAAGGIFSNVVLELDATIIETYTLAEGQKAKLRTITYV